MVSFGSVLSSNAQPDKTGRPLVRVCCWLVHVWAPPSDSLMSSQCSCSVKSKKGKAGRGGHLTTLYDSFMIRGRHGGWKKEGGGKPHERHPSQKRVLDPPSYGTFSTPLRCQCSVFPVQKSTTEQTRSSFGGVQKFSGERVLWYVFLPPYVLHPPISRPNMRILDILRYLATSCDIT